MRDAKIFLTMTAGVWLPAAQALAGGSMGFVIVATIAWANGADPWRWGAVGGAVAAGISWIGGMGWWRSQLTSNREPLPHQAETINVHATLDQGDGFLWGEFLDGLSVSRDQFERLAAELVRDQEFTGARFGGRGKLLSRDEFEALRGRLVAAGFVRWRSRGRTPGCELTYSGLAIMKHVAGSRQAQTHKSTNESGTW